MNRVSPPRAFLIRVGALASKEILHIQRDPRTLYLALVMPVVLLLLFGYGVSFDIDRLPLVVVDHAHSEQSRRLVDRFVATDEFRLVEVVRDEVEVEATFRSGRAAVGLVIPEDLDASLARGEVATVQLLVDGADGLTARTAMTRAETLARVATLDLLAERGLALQPPLQATTVTRFNPAGRSALFLVPGLAAYLLAMVAVLLTALTVAREWERGSMEQLFATPVGRLEIVLGKLLPYLGLGGVQVLLVLVVGAWVFDVPLRGNLLVVALASLLFMLGMLGQGLLISVITRNQLVATQAALMSSMLPSMLLSGFMFPIENMPGILRAVSHLIPARYFIEVLRGVLLRGNGWGEQWSQLLLLSGFALLMIAASTARFQRRLAPPPDPHPGG